MRTLVAAACGLLLLVCTSTALAAPPPSGLLSRLPGGTGCLTSALTPDCTTQALLADASDVVVAPDGRTIYAVAEGTTGRLVAFARDPATGAVGAVRACYAGTSTGGCTTVSALTNAADLAVDRSGRKLYVVAARAIASGGGALIVFPLLADGTPGAAESCFSQVDGGGGDCPAGATVAHADGLNQPVAVTVSPDGRTLYAASTGLRGGIAAFALNTATGAVTTQINCVSAPNVGGDVGDADCSSGINFADSVVHQARDIAVTPAGDRIVVVAHSHGGGVVAVYQREFAIGVIQGRLRCIAQTDDGTPCVDAYGLAFPNSVDISPDGTSAYVTTSASPDEGALVTLRLQSGSPHLSFLTCIKTGPAELCPTAVGLGGVRRALPSPDAKHLYVAASTASSLGTLRVLATGSNGAPDEASAQCFAQTTGGGCEGLVSLRGSSDVALAPAGAHLYVPGDRDGSGGGMSVFNREVAPGCTDVSATTTADAAVTFAGSCSDPNADPLTLEVVGAPSSGTATGAGSSLTFTPAAGFTGTATFAYRATDGTMASAPATATVTVGAAPAGPPPTGTTPTPMGTTPTPTPTDSRPTVRFSTTTRVRARSLKRIAGTASDDRGIRRVQVTIVRLTGGATAARARCTVMTSAGRFTTGKLKGKRCTTRRYLTAKGTTKWSLTLRRRLPVGSYAVFARVTDTAGQTSSRRLRLTVRR